MWRDKKRRLISEWNRHFLPNDSPAVVLVVRADHNQSISGHTWANYMGKVFKNRVEKWKNLPRKNIEKIDKIGGNNLPMNFHEAK